MSKAKLKEKPTKPEPPQPEPRQPIVGPTEEARAQHTFQRREVHKNDRRPYVRVTPNLLEMLKQRATITRQQAEAGGAFAQDHRMIWGSPGARDSCVQRIGGEVHETQAQAEAITRAKARTGRILNRAGPMAYAVMVQVCVYEEHLGRADRNTHRYAAFRSGADIAADVYGIPAYREEST